MENNMFRVYTDGACSGNPGPGGWGFVSTVPLRGADGSIATLDGKPTWVRTVVGHGGEKDTTNNRMELMAAIKALRFHLKYYEKDVTVITDSKYVMQGITEWIKGWKAKNWIGSNKKPVKNQDLWQQLDGLASQFHNLKWEWVKGHSGDQFNEVADQLAVMGVKSVTG